MVKPVLPLIHEQNEFSFVQNNVFSNGTIVKTQTTFELNELVSTFQTVRVKIKPNFYFHYIYR